jgi:hypothetical protein
LSQIDETKQAEDYSELIALMAQVFPGYESFAPDSVTPSITGQGSLVSYLVVCNDEAARDFREQEEIAAVVVPSVQPSRKGQGQDLVLRLEFSFPWFSLQFFTAVEGENSEQQKEFARILTAVDFFIIWVVDKDKNLLKVLQVKWEKEKYLDVLNKIQGAETSAT